MAEFINPLSFAGASQPRLEAIAPGEKAVSDLRRGLAQVASQGRNQANTQRIANEGALDNTFAGMALQRGDPNFAKNLAEVFTSINAERGARTLDSLGQVGIYADPPERASVRGITMPTVPTRQDIPIGVRQAAAGNPKVTGTDTAGTEKKEWVFENGRYFQLTTKSGTSRKVVATGEDAPEVVRDLLRRAKANPKFTGKDVSVIEDPRSSSGYAIKVPDDPLSPYGLK